MCMQHSAVISLVIDNLQSQLYVICAQASLRSWPAVRTVSLERFAYEYFSAAFKSAILFAMTIHTASQMQFNASSSPTQPCLTTYYTCTVPWSKHFTRLCKWVHPWESVSEIRSVQETLLQLCLRQLMLKTRKRQACIVTSCVTFAQKAGQAFAFKSVIPDTQGCDILACDTIYLCSTHISWYAESCKERTTTHW